MTQMKQIFLEGESATLKFWDKMDWTVQMRIIYYVKHRWAIRLKIGNKFLTDLTKLVIRAKSNIYPTLKENLFLYSRKFVAFIVIVII